jgi:hypothetical protein
MPGLVTCRNCLLKYVIEGNIGGMKEVTGIRGRRRKQVLDALKEEEGTGNRKKKHSIALCGELALQNAMDLS